MGFFTKKTEQQQMQEINQKLQKKRQAIHNIIHKHLIEIAELQIGIDTTNEQPNDRTQKKIQKLQEKLEELKKQMINCIKESEEAFIIEDDNGQPITQEQLQKMPVTQVEEYFIEIINELERIA